MKNLAIAAIGIAATALCGVGALAYDILRRPDDSCRVQVQDSEQRIRHALWEANRAHDNKIGVLIRELGLAP